MITVSVGLTVKVRNYRTAWENSGSFKNWRLWYFAVKPLILNEFRKIPLKTCILPGWGWLIESWHQPNSSKYSQPLWITREMLPEVLKLEFEVSLETTLPGTAAGFCYHLTQIYWGIICIQFSWVTVDIQHYSFKVCSIIIWFTYTRKWSS